MAKLAILTAVVAAIVAVQGLPVSDKEISDAASEGNWDLLQKLVREQFNEQTGWEPGFSSGSVRSLKQPPGGHVFGKSEYSFHTSSNVNGKTSENSGGHRIINNDGKIEEFDF